MLEHWKAGGLSRAREAGPRGQSVSVRVSVCVSVWAWACVSVWACESVSECDCMCVCARSRVRYCGSLPEGAHVHACVLGEYLSVCEACSRRRNSPGREPAIKERTVPRTWQEVVLTEWGEYERVKTECEPLSKGLCALTCLLLFYTSKGESHCPLPFFHPLSF